MTSASPDRPVVVLLHGLGRTARSLAGLRRAIEGAGWETWARTYPSRQAPIQALADEVAAAIRADLPDRPLLAVTHSLGGILVRHMAGALPWRGVVMLAPPNTGSHLARSLSDLAMFRWFFGPAGQEVGRADDWPAPPQPFAVIAGTVADSVASPPSWIGRRLLPAEEPSDGTVLVHETRLPDMADFREVAASHTWVMNHPDARAQVLHFLEHLRFA